MRRKTQLALWALFLGCGLAQAAEFFVSPGGNDAGPGNRAHPFASLEAARDAARRAAPGSNDIILLPGNYFPQKTLELNHRDNGLTIEGVQPGAAVIWGGGPLNDWKRANSNLWFAPVPGVKEETRDFRVLVVNGRMAERARFPECGEFHHENIFNLKWLGTAAGGWERPPTADEMTALHYDPNDLPPALDFRNAEVRIYHMWDESLVRVLSNDAAHHVLRISKPSSPPGSFGVNKYIVFNTKEGMTHPGQWYLDRTQGRVVYWPLPGENMAEAFVVAPKLERIIAVEGADYISLRGFDLRATTTPLKAAGFGAFDCDGALRLDHARNCSIRELQISDVGGQGILGRDVTRCQISGCQIHHAGACGIRVAGRDSVIADNRIHDAGLIHSSGIGLAAAHGGTNDGEKGFQLRGNEISDVPYSGIDCRGANNIIDGNSISRVMLEMRDGGAIYGMMRQSVIRGNAAFDTARPTDDRQASAYYLDEGSEHCLVENNISAGFERPTHNHLASGIQVNNNVFAAPSNMVISFQGSSDCAVEGNLFCAPGQIKTYRPAAIVLWTNNLIYHDDVCGEFGGLFALDTSMPPSLEAAPRGIPVVHAVSVSRAPHLDEFRAEEWPGAAIKVDRDSSGGESAGPPAILRLAHDAQYLYVAVSIPMFDIGQLRRGTNWETDDAVEIFIQSPRGVFVLRGFAGGAQENKDIPFHASSYGKSKDDLKSGWRGQFAIPFARLGLVPSPGLKVPFNVTVSRGHRDAPQFLRAVKDGKSGPASILQLQ